jgi:N-hydroxyarylamine O-acetyltransferase
MQHLAGQMDGTLSEHHVDLDAYFSRIGYNGPHTPTLDTLRALQALHPAAIPYEAIDVLLGLGIDIAPAAIDGKLIVRRRGGYCYEQSGLFKRVLETLGFDVAGLVGRVQWMSHPGSPAPARGHMALRVTIDGEPWLADVGFGPCGPTSPLRMGIAEPQLTRYEMFRLLPSAEGERLEILLERTWEPVYDLSREPHLDVDYIALNWFASTHPSSRFRRELMVARTTAEARHTLLNNRLTVRTPGRDSERKILTADQIEQALMETFDLPVVSNWWPFIERAAAAGFDQ